MENEILNEQQPAPSVEKVSVKELKKEQGKLELENNKLVKDFIDSVMALSNEDLDRALAFLNKKLDMLKKIK